MFYCRNFLTQTVPKTSGKLGFTLMNDAIKHWDLKLATSNSLPLHFRGSLHAVDLMPFLTKISLKAFPFGRVPKS